MGALKTLRIPAFRRLALAYTINRFGDTLGLIALAGVVYAKTGSAAATTALFMAMEFLPSLAAPAVAARLDRIAVAPTLAVVFGVEAVCFAVLGLLTHHFGLAAFLAIVAFDGVLAIAGRAICRGAAAQVLDATDQLREGNAVINLLYSPAFALGAFAGGAAVATVGADVALFADAATFVVAAAMCGTARGLPRYEDEPDPEPWRARLRDGFAYLGRHPYATTLIVGQALAMVFFSLTMPIEVAYTRDTLNAGDAGYGALFGAWGIGLIVGSAAYAPLARRHLGAAAIGSTILQGVSYAGLGVSPDIYVACVVAAVGGAANGVQWVALTTAIQEVTAIDYQVRVMAVFESLTTLSPGIGFVLGGAIAVAVSPRAAFVVAAVGTLAVVAGVAALRPWRQPRVARVLT
ncbi:MAG TPA: MFS transporter [Thermoleophilaceae bacterium]